MSGDRHVAGKRADRIIVDDPETPADPVALVAELRRVRALFQLRGIEAAMGVWPKAGGQ